MLHLTQFSWDDWVPGDRLRKFNDENLELAASLKGQADELRRQSAPTIPTGKPRKRPLESDLSSARASEDGQTNARGHKRGREHNDIEKVCEFYIFMHVHLVCLIYIVGQTRGVSPSFRDAASTEQTLGRRPAIASQRPPLNRLVPSS